MERWSGVLSVPLCSESGTFHRVGASLCFSSQTRNLSVPIANAIFFCGDRVERTGNPLIEKLSDLQKLSEIVVSKFGSSINAWVIQDSVFNGPFAVYKDFIPSVNQYGEPKHYCPIGFPATTSIVALLSSCLEQVRKIIPGRQVDAPSCSLHQPKTIILGFSKGGTVLNQIVTELGFSDIGSNVNSTDAEICLVPKTTEALLNSISEIHYVDVGLNSTGAYLTNRDVFERISERLVREAPRLRFVLHGTPRQWNDKQRDWIRKEKDEMLLMLESEAGKSGGKLEVLSRYYFADKPPNLQMHFKIIESLDLFTTITVNEPAPGVKAILSFKVPEQTSGKVELQYLHEYAGISSSVGLKAYPIVNFSSVIGTNALSVGDDLSFDTKLGFSTSQVLSLVMNKLYKQFVEKDIKEFEAFHVAILDTFNTINMALTGKHYDAPSYKDTKEIFKRWEESNEEARKEMFRDFVNNNVNLNKVDESMIITAIVAPPAAMVAKRTGQGMLPQLKFMNAIPDVVFVPSATVLALIAVKILSLVFIGNGTTSKAATTSFVDHVVQPSSVDNILPSVAPETISDHSQQDILKPALDHSHQDIPKHTLDHSRQDIPKPVPDRSQQDIPKPAPDCSQQDIPKPAADHSQQDIPKIASDYSQQDKNIRYPNVPLVPLSAQSLEIKVLKNGQRLRMAMLNTVRISHNHSKDTRC